MCPVSRRDFIKDLYFAAALIGLPQWALDLNESPAVQAATCRRTRSRGSAYRRQNSAM